MKSTAAAAVALGLVAALLPTAAGAAPRDPQPAPGRLAGQPVPAASADVARTYDRVIAAPGRQQGGALERVRLVVQADSRAALPAARRAVSQFGQPRAAGVARLGYLTVEVPAGRARAVAAQLAAQPGVKSVQAASSRSLHLTPNDTLYATQQQTMFTGMQAPTAWNTSTGNGVRIAILDGGFDVTHPDLAAKIVDTWDAAMSDTSVGDPAGSPGLGHGTATATTAAAVTGNSQGIAGSAPDADLLLVKVADDAGDLDSVGSAAGIVWAADNGADVISMSYGGAGATTIERDAVAYARSKGVVVIASAGNDKADGFNYPAAFAGVISVGSTTLNGTTQSDWSTDGSWIDVAAPGESVPVALPLAADTEDGNANGYTRWDGTSFSGPLVAGLAAVLIAHRPQAPATTIESAIIGTTQPITTPAGVLPYGHGLVQFDDALAALPDPTAITAPADGATVTGDVTVSATSGSPKVRFSYVGTGVSVTADVVAGVATATLPTYGLDAGAATIQAVSCDASSCAGTGPEVFVTLTANDAPTVTAPTEGAAIGVLLTASADAPAGAAVRFVIDGTTVIGTDTTSPFSVTYDTAALADGPHSVTALLCSAKAPSVCEADNPSAAVGFTLLRLRPTVKVSVSPFSPNGDGRRDTTSGTYTLEQTSTAVLRIYNAGGGLVRGPVTLTTNKAAGTYAWSWNGRSNGGTVQADGLYTVRVTTTGTKEATAVEGVATASVRIDRTKPALSSTSASPSTFYPVVDSYKDTAGLGVTTKETASAVTVSIYNSAGTRVRTLSYTGSKAAGRVALAWNGRSTSGSLVKAGTYTFAVTVQDLAGNRAVTGRAKVVVSAKKLVKKFATKTLGPLAYSSGWLSDGPCSFALSDVWYGYPNSLGFFSQGNGCSDTAEDYVFGVFSYTLPAALKYGNVRLSAYSGPHYLNGDTGFAELITAAGADGAIWTLGSNDGSYAGPSVSPASYLQGGRKLRWLAGTGFGNSYDVRNFVVSWSYYVLQ